MFEALLLVLVWLGGWMVIVGLNLAGGWLLLWSLMMLLLLVADVRQHVRRRAKFQVPKRAEPGDHHEPESIAVSVPLPTAPIQGAPEHTSETSRQTGWEPFRKERFPGFQAFESDGKTDTAPRPKGGPDSPIAASPPEPKSPAHGAKPVESKPVKEPVQRDESESPGVGPSEYVAGTSALPKILAQFSKERFPIRATAPEPVPPKPHVPVSPIAPQFVRPRTPIDITQEAAILPSPPDRPLGPSGEARRTNAPSSTPAGPRKLRTPRPILRPEDFQQNAGIPGFLYLARNEEHWTGLHKVGQTRNHPSGRVAQLNKEHGKLTDIGDFQLMDVVPVVDAYGAEQVLFQVLDDLRPARGREFFIADRPFLSEAMQAAARFICGDDEWLNRIFQDVDRGDQPAWPAYPDRYNYRAAGRPPGWVFIARNRFHAADTYRVSASVKLPDVVIKEWNNFQRTVTPQIGFYSVVYAVPVVNYVQAGTIGKRALARWKLDGQRSFFRGPLSELAGALSAALQDATD